MPRHWKFTQYHRTTQPPFKILFARRKTVHIISDRPSVCLFNNFKYPLHNFGDVQRPRTKTPPTIFGGVVLLYLFIFFFFENRVSSLTPISPRIFSWKLVQNKASSDNVQRKINNILHLYIFRIIPIWNNMYKNRVCSIISKPSKIFQWNMVQILSLTKQCADEKNRYSTYITCFEIFHMKKYSLCNSITLKPSKIFL